MLKDNLKSYKKSAMEYFENERERTNNLLDTDFRYRVATDIPAYNIENVRYYPNNFKKTLHELIINNPYTQLTEVFKRDFDIDVLKHLQDQDEYILILETLSDVGSLKLGNDELTILIPNGYGDGITTVVITTKNIHVPMKYFTKIEGEFVIYEYDCGTDVECIVSGEFNIYCEDSIVVFNKVN